MKTQKFNVTGMTCAACQANVTRRVQKLEGVKDVDVNLLSGRMTVEYDESALTAPAICAAVQEIGYGASDAETPSQGAQAQAEAEGLTLGEPVSGYSADAPAGTVIAQSIPPGEVVAEGTELILTVSQPRQMLYYPPSNYTLYVPLSNVEVVLEIVPPSGAAFTGFSGTLDAGTYSIELSSVEQGLHTVREYMDGVLMVETQVMFE